MHLKRRFRNGADVVVENTGSENRHHILVRRHTITQDTQMVVVDINTAAELHDIREFVEDRLSRRLNAEHIERLLNIVTIGSFRVDEIHAQHTHQVRAGGIQYPDVFAHVFGILLYDIVLQFPRRNVLDILYSTQHDVVEERVLEIP